MWRIHNQVLAMMIYGLRPILVETCEQHFQLPILQEMVQQLASTTVGEFA